MHRNNKVVKGKPSIEGLYGDNIILDILKISYNDLIRGRFTPVRRIIRLISRDYPGISATYIDSIIRIIINSKWFSRVNPQEVHLLERGVEVYLIMRQNHLSEQWARDVNYKTQWVIFLTVLGLLATVTGIILASGK